MLLQVSHLRCEFAINPLGLQGHVPRFSWLLDHSERGQWQSAYEIQVASSLAKLVTNQADLWASGQQPMTASPLIAYAGLPLFSRQRCYWRVRVWDAQERLSEYSAPSWFEMGLLQPQDWHAEWIGFPAGWNGKALYFRTTFQVEKPLRQARVYSSGLGYYELSLNGQKVGERVLDPAQTDYGKTVCYTVDDVTDLIRPGLNVVGAIVGNGWYGSPKLLTQIELQFTDGSIAHVLTGKTGQGGNWWRVCDSPIVENSVYDGEVYDARLERPNWNTCPQDEMLYQEMGVWGWAMVVEPPGGKLVSQTLEPIQIVETRPLRTLQHLPSGVYVADTGQNLAGWVRIQAHGERGTAITLRFAESLHEDGTVNQQNLRAARARDMYIFKGDGLETWEPRFTYHGFRYVQIENDSGVLTLDSIEVRVVRSAVAQVGHFSCDHPLINALHSAVQWTEASNLHSLPTDCPQRDERAGWLNDQTARAEEALYNFDHARLFPKWLNDIADSQDVVNGAIPDTAPFRWGNRPGDPVNICYVQLPWLLYLHYGDECPMRLHYPGMKRWVDYLSGRTQNDILEYSHYGDWAPPLAQARPGSGGDSAISNNTPGPLVSTAHYYMMLSLLVQMADVMGEAENARDYRALAERIYVAFNRKFWDETVGGYGSNNQACNAIALYFDLVPEPLKTRVVQNLVCDVMDIHEGHITTGNLATKYIMEALTQGGQSETALALATQTSYPSWGYMLANGATTIWERWENSVGGGMNSHNHPMLGSVGAWLYRTLAGLRIDGPLPGFGQFTVAPFFTGAINHVEASLQTVRGMIAITWERDTNGLSLRVQVPMNTQAVLTFPKPLAEQAWCLKEGETVMWAQDEAASPVEGVLEIRPVGDTLRLTIGSGRYTFVVQHL